MLKAEKREGHEGRDKIDSCDDELNLLGRTTFAEIILFLSSSLVFRRRRRRLQDEDEG